MDAPTSPVRIAVPTEPYPGLRPFLDHESALLFGRQRQVLEVIDRLRQTQFVAVIGGSGSGKSSLIHAGVVPELRSFGIPGAGDFWIPMVCTPGTNAVDAEAAQRQTPVVRLSWKFSQLLRSLGSPNEEALRREKIAQVFRQRAGFSRLMDTFAEQLAVPDGLAPGDARLLFVIDQFEELFHPTNKDVQDCRRMVEGVIDHFFHPHPNCYVVLTMRSEHLNDCVGYLELPDAINKSSYLVRRLDKEELREAIIGPAQRFLRLLKRKGGDTVKLPDSVQFEDTVIERLLQDVGSIAHDSDHLPLLQHLLARLWEVARSKQGPGAILPEKITWDDLQKAVSAQISGPPQVFGDANTLRHSLENWAEGLYRKKPEEQKGQIQSLLRRLAFKDPGTGQYTQQRVNVDDCTGILGPGGTREGLRALIKDGYLGSVDYLFWDQENPETVTLKVSHETFIRGWQRFRQLVDKEADRLEEFADALRKCMAWQEKEQPRHLLLQAAELRRLDDAGLTGVLANKHERAVLMRLLALDRDGPRLMKFEPALNNFLKKSKHAHRQSRQLWIGGAAALLMLVPLALYFALIQGPVAERAGLFFDAADSANRASQFTGFQALGSKDSLNALANLKNAAEIEKKGRLGQGLGSAWLLNALSWLPPVAQQKHFLHKFAAHAEPQINYQLRSVLTSALWLSSATSKAPHRWSIASPESLSTRCGDIPDQGWLFHESVSATQQIARGLFVLTPSQGDSLVIYDATYAGKGGKCAPGKIVFSIPRTLQPHLVFDAGMHYLFLSIDNGQGATPAVTVYQMDWELSADGSTWQANLDYAPITVITGLEGAGLVKGVKGADNGNSLTTWRTLGGYIFSLGGKNLRVVTSSAQDLGEISEGMKPLAISSEQSACDKLGKALSNNNKQDKDQQAGFTLRMFDVQELPYCFAVTRGNPPTPASGNAPTPSSSSTSGGSRLERVVVSVYDKPELQDFDRSDYAPPASIAGWKLFGRIDKEITCWSVGTAGQYEGWVAAHDCKAGASTRYFGGPWSTDALKRLSDDILPGAEQTALGPDSSLPAAH